MINNYVKNENYGMFPVNRKCTRFQQNNYVYNKPLILNTLYI